MEKSTIELVSEITEFNDLSEYMNDTDLDTALDLIIKLITKPDVPSVKASVLVVQIQAISAKFAILARYYTTFEKGQEASKKKNAYYTMAEELDKLAAAMKYASKLSI